MTVDRRTVLEIAGGTIVGSALHNADWPTSILSTPDGEMPTYSDWLTLEEGAVTYTHVDWTALEEYVMAELEETDPDEELPEAYEDDPMIAPASDGLLSTYLFGTFSLAAYRLGRLLEDEAFDSRVEALLDVNDAFVLEGAMEPAELDEQLTAEPEAEFVTQMELTDAIDEYDVYEPIDGDDVVIALGSDALVVIERGESAQDELQASLETVLGAASGDLERATDESEDFALLVETAGHGDVSVGQYGGPFETDEFQHPAFAGFEEATGFISSLTVEDEETLTGTFGALLEDPDEDALEARLGVSADERSIDIADDRVTATATWREEMLEE